MNQGKYVLAQIFEFVSHNDFLKCVNKYNGDYKTKHFSCWKQFLCMPLDNLLTEKVYLIPYFVLKQTKESYII